MRAQIEGQVAEGGARAAISDDATVRPRAALDDDYSPLASQELTLFLFQLVRLGWWLGVQSEKSYKIWHRVPAVVVLQARQGSA